MIGSEKVSLAVCPIPELRFRVNRRLAQFALRSLLLSATGFLISGCGTVSMEATKPDPASERPVHVGWIGSVNDNGRFVLVETIGGKAGERGKQWFAKNANGETSELLVGGESRRPFTVANILTGNPTVGDQVYERIAPAPAGTSNQAVSGLPVPPVGPAPEGGSSETASPGGTFVLPDRAPDTSEAPSNFHLPSRLPSMVPEGDAGPGDGELPVSPQ